MKGDTRCDNGRLMRHDQQEDDPELETDIGECPDCRGYGCLDMTMFFEDKISTEEADAWT